MGCSASRLDTLIAKAIEDPSSSSTSTSSFSSSSSSASSSMVPKTRSLSTPLVHHPAVKKGDTHHLVCLTSSSYGSIVVVDNHHLSSSSAVVEDDGFSGKSSPDSVINTWELMEGLEDEENVDSGNDFKVKSLTLCDFKDAQKLPASKLGFHLVDSGTDFKVKPSNLCDFKDAQKLPASKFGLHLVDSGSDFKVKSSNLCSFSDAQKSPASKLVDSGSKFKVKASNVCKLEDAHKLAARLGINLNDSSSDFKVKPSNLCDSKDGEKLPGSRLGLNLADSLTKLSESYVFVDATNEIVEEEEVEFELNPSTKPLWKHLSEESLLAKMDPNVGNAYERALTGNKLGYSESRNVSKSVGSSPFVVNSKSMGSTAPVASKLASYDNGCNVHTCEDKIVLYFTSLRGIRKTFEDCSFVRMVLRGFRVVVDERDISMDSSYRKELQSALLGKAMSLPQLFIRGKHIGGADDVKLLHETGELERILEGCPTRDCGSVCQSCGDARFVPCSNCSGSRKVFQEEEGRTRKCPDCNENGLVRCPGCCL